MQFVDKTINVLNDWSKLEKIEQPIDLNIQLFPHQLVTVYNMELLEKTRTIKIDDNVIYKTSMGVGVDGGINLATIQEVSSASVTDIALGSSVFFGNKPEEKLEQFSKLI